MITASIAHAALSLGSSLLGVIRDARLHKEITSSMIAGTTRPTLIQLALGLHLAVNVIQHADVWSVNKRI